MTTQQRLEALELAVSQNKSDDDRVLNTLDTIAEVLSLLVARQEMEQLKDDMDPVKRKIIALDMDVTAMKAIVEGEGIHGNR